MVCFPTTYPKPMSCSRARARARAPKQLATAGDPLAEKQAPVRGQLVRVCGFSAPQSIGHHFRGPGRVGVVNGYHGPRPRTGTAFGAERAAGLPDSTGTEGLEALAGALCAPRVLLGTWLLAAWRLAMPAARGVRATEGRRCDMPLPGDISILTYFCHGALPLCPSASRCDSRNVPWKESLNVLGPVQPRQGASFHYSNMGVLAMVFLGIDLDLF